MTSFEKALQPLINSRHIWQVWDDWTFLTATAISNITDFRQEREDQYKKISAQYSDKELDIFAEMFAIMTYEFDNNPEQDFLGSLYMQLNLGDHWKGQFFTPYSVCQAMAEIAISDKVYSDIDEKGYITVNDCACGAGATLIAAYHTARKRLEKVGKNAQNCVLIAAQDISQMTACMCYLQLSMLGIAAVVKVGNTLTDPICGNLLLLPHMSNLWFTPMYSFPIWSGRRICAIMDNS